VPQCTATSRLVVIIAIGAADTHCMYAMLTWLACWQGYCEYTLRAGHKRMFACHNRGSGRRKKVESYEIARHRTGVGPRRTVSQSGAHTFVSVLRWANLLLPWEGVHDNMRGEHDTTGMGTVLVGHSGSGSAAGKVGAASDDRMTTADAAA